MEIRYSMKRKFLKSKGSTSDDPQVARIRNQSKFLEEQAHNVKVGGFVCSGLFSLLLMLCVCVCGSSFHAVLSPRHRVKGYRALWEVFW
jgi:hypothetical protein